MLFSFCSGLKECYLAIYYYLHHQFFIQQQFQADGMLFPHLHKALLVIGNPKNPDSNPTNKINP